MNILFSEKAKRDYKNLPGLLQKTADKQFDFLLNDLRHPSLHTKKYEEARGVWQARINKNWRFYFRISDDIYQIITIIKHSN